MIVCFQPKGKVSLVIYYHNRDIFPPERTAAQ